MSEPFDSARKWARGSKLKKAIYIGVLVVGAGVAMMFGYHKQADTAYNEARSFSIEDVSQTETVPAEQ